MLGDKVVGEQLGAALPRGHACSKHSQECQNKRSDHYLRAMRTGEDWKEKRADRCALELHLRASMYSKLENANGRRDVLDMGVHSGIHNLNPNVEMSEVR